MLGDDSLISYEVSFLSSTATSVNMTATYIAVAAAVS